MTEDTKTEVTLTPLETYATKSELKNEAQLRTTNDNLINNSINSLRTSTTNNLATKQNITDNTLNTHNKTVPGAINEILSNTQEQQTNLSTTSSALDAKQDKTDNTLNTKIKTVPGAINELNQKIDSWTTVGTSENSRTWNYNLVLNKKYRVSYNWSTNDYTSKNYREFVWGGNDNSIETYHNGFSGLTILGVTILGTANIIEIVATSTGIEIANLSGSSSAGRIIGLEQAS